MNGGIKVHHKDEIERLERQLQEAKNAQKKLESSCHHQWEEPKYDPKYEDNYVFKGYTGHGSDPTPVYDTIKDDKKSDRWSRSCLRCGKKEYTTQTEAVKTKPKF